MILAVVGSHDFKYLEKSLDALKPESVLTGFFWGTDKAARQWAIDNGVTIITLNPNFVKHGTRAMRIRNEQIAMISDEMLFCGAPNPVSYQAALFMGNSGKMVWYADSLFDDSGNNTPVGPARD